MTVTALRPDKRTQMGLALRPFPIRNETDYGKALEKIEPLAVKSRHKRAERDFFEIMTILIDRYEEERHPIETSAVSAIEALKHLLQENGLTGADLGRILGTRTQGYPILRGERSLSKNQIIKLGHYFGVSPALFLDD